jgi:hypothetical protein
VDPDTPDAVVQLLLAEHQQAYEMYRHSEELGERRVNFFLTLVTAVFAALLLADEPLVSGDDVSLVAHALLVGVFLFGLMTLARIVRRNENSSAQLRAIATIRLYFRQRDEVACSYLDFDRARPTTAGLRPESRARKFALKRIVGTAGLADTMQLLNAAVFGLLAALALVDASAGPVPATIGGAVAGVLMWAAQFREINRFYRRNDARRELSEPLRLTDAQT